MKRKNWAPIKIKHPWTPRDSACTFCDDPREDSRHMGTGHDAGLYIVMVDDRHTGGWAYPFSTEQAALDFARATAANWLVEDPQPPDGWLYFAEHPTETDSIRVVRKFTDEPGRKA